MTAQILDRALTAYRIGDPAGAYPIFDAGGSIFGGQGFMPELFDDAFDAQ